MFVVDTFVNKDKTTMVFESWLSNGKKQTKKQNKKKLVKRNKIKKKQNPESMLTCTLVNTLSLSLSLTPQHTSAEEKKLSRQLTPTGHSQTQGLELRKAITLSKLSTWEKRNRAPRSLIHILKTSLKSEIRVDVKKIPHKTRSIYGAIHFKVHTHKYIYIYIYIFIQSRWLHISQTLSHHHIDRFWSVI